MTGCNGTVADIRKIKFFQILINSIDYMFGIGLWPGRFLAFFLNGFFRWVFLLPRVGAGWANRANGFGPGRPMGQKILTGRVTARVKNRVKHTFFDKL
jgi:hypothetical protein